MVVGSSDGISATHGAGDRTGSRSSGSSQALPPASATSTAPTAERAALVWVTVQPVHHLMSAVVAGPYAVR